MSDICFFEILAGKSRLLPETGGVFFYKHPTLFELEMSSELTEVHTLRAKANGMMTEQELLDSAKTNKRWSTEEEEEMSELLWLVPKQERVIKKFENEPSLKMELEANLKETKWRHDELKIKRESLTRFSLEEYVNRKTNMALFSKFLFEDEACSELLDERTLTKVMPSFVEKYESLSDTDKTLHRCYTPSFYETFLLSGDSPLAIFGKTYYEITLFQKNLLLFSFILRKKVDNTPDLPNEIVKDPVKLYNYNTETKKVEEDMGNIRDFVQSKGGEENLKAEDYLT